MNEIVDPTIRDFELDHPASRRHAFIACVVTFDCIDYLAHPKKSGNLRTQLRKNSDFAIVDRVAHLFKHVKTGDPKNPKKQPLTSSSVFERPPGMAGVMQAGLSRVGDKVGSVEIWGEDRPYVLHAVKGAPNFCAAK